MHTMNPQEQKILEQTIGGLEAAVYWLKYKSVISAVETNKAFNEKLKELIDTNER